jgi:hypothetical protein
MGVRSGTLAVVVAVGLVALSLAPAVGLAQESSQECESIDGSQVCIQEASITSDTLRTGDSAELTVTVKNAGDDEATFFVALVVSSPNNETQSFFLKRDGDEQVTLAPGETATFDQPVDPSTPGTHALQFRTVTPDREGAYDASEIITVEVQQPKTGLGGRIDRSEIALVALLGSLAVLGGLAYRQRQ